MNLGFSASYGSTYHAANFQNTVDFGCSAKQLLRYLKLRDDITCLGQKGSSHINYKAGDGTRFAVTTSKKDVPIGTLGKIARALGMNATKLDEAVRNT
jgi:predicted RNA binding protein YcfA (HicA-like mRNA interferase family)